ncbi:hypothetical protein BRD11_01020, partial [Halobacteriales archaeon SW_12_69_24]
MLEFTGPVGLYAVVRTGDGRLGIGVRSGREDPVYACPRSMIHPEHSRRTFARMIPLIGRIDRYTLES